MKDTNLPPTMAWPYVSSKPGNEIASVILSMAADIATKNIQLAQYKATPL